jgi:excisionase family DNA binding protein
VTVDERVNQLLLGVSIEDILRGREIEEAGKFLGVSTATAYRYIADRTLSHVKVEGTRRRGRGCAGLVRVRLLDLVTFMATNEVMPGTKKTTVITPVVPAKSKRVAAGA